MAALRRVETAPETGDFTPIQEHQEQTPTTFFDGLPVLYAHYTGLTLSVSADQLNSDAAFAKFSAYPEGSSTALIKDVDIWVSSDNLILFQNSPTPTGIEIPYPSIALHATMKYRSQTEALYMNISLNDFNEVNDEDDIKTLELTVLPPNYATSDSDASCIKEIFNAMNTCADLHPDADDSDNEGGAAESTEPGASGWITAENMDEHLDEDGNFKGAVFGDADEEQLGPGAGNVRQRDDEEEDENANGTDGANGETKWKRTD